MSAPELSFTLKPGLTASHAVKLCAKQFRICPLKRPLASAGWVLTQKAHNCRSKGLYKALIIYITYFITIRVVFLIISYKTNVKANLFTNINCKQKTVSGAIISRIFIRYPSYSDFFSPHPGQHPGGSAIRPNFNKFFLTSRFLIQN